jgi:hypothetical protein
MWDRFEPRDDARDRDSAWDRSLGGRGSTSDRIWNDERDPRDVFTRDIDLPRGRERRPVRDRDRVYEIDGTESRMLATIGAFRVVSETDLHDLRDDSAPRRRFPPAYAAHRPRPTRCRNPQTLRRGRPCCLKNLLQPSRSRT